MSPAVGIGTALIGVALVAAAGRYRYAVLVLFALLGVVHVITVLGGFLLVGKLMRLAIREVGLFWGTILRFRVGRCTVRIGWLTITGYVSYYSATAGRRPRAAVGKLFEELTPAQRALVAVSGPVAALVTALVILTPAEGLRSFVNAFAQLFGALVGQPSPVGEVAAFLERLGRGEWVGSLGTLAAKMAAVNLLPLPGITGGGIALTQLWEWVWGRKIPDVFVTRAAMVGFALFLTLLAPWGYSLFKVVFGSGGS